MIFLRKPETTTRLFLMFVFITLTLFISHPAAAASHILSTNIPLGSPIYTYLDKLDGLGFLHDIQTGTKPYTRMQVARWVKQIKGNTIYSPQLPAYATNILLKLEVEFAYELGQLDGAHSQNSLHIKELSWNNTYYDGELLEQHHTSSHYQPLYTNQNGYRLAEGMNSIFSAAVNGQASDYLYFSLDPQLSYDNDNNGSADLTSGYLVTGLGNIQVQLGKDSMWWGPGQWGNLSLTNNSEALTAYKISNIDPIPLDGLLKIFGRINASFFYANLNGERSDVQNPSFVGLRLESIPTSNFTFGGSLNSIVGGDGHRFHLGDMGDYVTQKNADTARNDKWDSIAGFDFRWRLPWSGVQVYGALYGEDEAGEIIPLPSRNAYILGVYLPRLLADESWDLRFETARTTHYWYEHGVYHDGYVDQDQIIGDAMGYNADRYSAQLGHYLTNGSRLAFFIEHLVMDKDAAFPQTVNSLMITYQLELVDCLTLSTTIGVADIGHLNYQAGENDQNYLIGFKLTKKF
jgi:hypothetical protein